MSGPTRNDSTGWRAGRSEDKEQENNADFAKLVATAKAQAAIQGIEVEDLPDGAWSIRRHGLTLGTVSGLGPLVATINGYQSELFELPPLSPRMPGPGTLPAMALELLAAGVVLDHRAFDRLTDSWRLGSVIHELRRLGWPVEDYTVGDRSGSGNHRTVSNYYLGDEGQRVYAGFAGDDETGGDE